MIHKLKMNVELVTDPNQWAWNNFWYIIVHSNSQVNMQSQAWIIYIWLIYMIHMVQLCETSDCRQLQWHSWILILFLVPIFAEVDDQYQVSNKLQSDFNSMIQPFYRWTDHEKGHCRTAIHKYI